MKIKNIVIKLILILFVLWFGLSAARFPVAIYAEDETPTPIPTATTEPSPTEEPVSSETPTPTPEESIPPSPSVSPTPTETPEDPTPDASTESLGVELETPTPTPDTLQETGDVTSSTLSLAQGNTLEVETATSNEDCDPKNNGEPPSSGSPSAVISNQDLEAATTSTSSAVSGNNVVSGNITQQITGDALALATAISIANVSLVGSNVYYLVDTITGTASGNLNFYELFLQMLLSSSDTATDLTVVSNQQSSQDTFSCASSDTGGNIVLGNYVSSETGNATAVANSLNLANFLLIGSTGIFSVVNIAGTLEGDIILPNFSALGGDTPWQSVVVKNTQTANILSSSLADSNTGGNVFDASGTSTSGNATSVANSISIANVLKIGESWGLVILNVFGNWQGNVKNWETPGSVSKAGYGTTILEKEGGNGNPSSEGGGNLTVISNQSADMSTASLADTNTGNNFLKGDSGSLNTGDALSLSNSFSLANLVGIGENFFVGVFNVISNWFGNLVVAFPDLEVTISDNKDQVVPGEPLEYTVTLRNRGDGYANGVSLGVTPPKEFTAQEGLSWDIPQVAPGEKLTFRSRGYITSDISSEGDLLATANVSITEDEESRDNNSASDLTKLVIPQFSGEDSGNQDHTLPVLTISIKNNVGKYVYPGDTVLTEVVVENLGPVKAKDVVINGALSNDFPMPPIPLGKSIGEVEAGGRKISNFKITLTKKLPEGTYHLAAYAKGYNLAGDEAVSSPSYSDFYVKVAGFASKISSSTEAYEGETLGMMDEGAPPSSSLLVRWKKYLPYAFGASLLTLLVVTLAKRKLKGEILLPLPAFLARKNLNRKAFKNLAVKIAGITGLFFGLLILFSKIFHRR